MRALETDTQPDVLYKSVSLRNARKNNWMLLGGLQCGERHKTAELGMIT